MTGALVGIGAHRAVDTGGSPGWATYVVIVVILLCACVSLWLAASSDRHGGDDSSDDWGGGRRGPAGGPMPPPCPTDYEPEWWPEFERAFAAYASRCLTHA